MLDKKTIDIIKSTVPVLEEYGVSITKRFYELLFTNHPELLNVFNHVNQKQGRQQTALANAVLAAAKYIDDLTAILPAVSQIAQKHRSLGIQAEQYPIVGENLIHAIKDVLKEAATDEIIEAWTKAYGEISNAFIGVERDLYGAAEQAVGGWKDFRPFTIWKKVVESDVITSFYLIPADGKEIASFKSGQYISVKLNIPGIEFTHIRQYSLSDSSDKDYYRISVKRESGRNSAPDGVVSNYLHSTINEGDTINISAPGGDFMLTPTRKPIVLLSGGVGITPMMSMFNYLVGKDLPVPVTFIHAAINGNFHAFKDTRLNSVSNKDLNIFYAYEKPTNADRQENSFDHEGYLDADTLNKWIFNKDSIVYFCGPIPFMKAMNHALKEIGIPEDHIHFEFFGPALTL
jgi:nitric oxide dioxygenase